MYLKMTLGPSSLYMFRSKNKFDMLWLLVLLVVVTATQSFEMDHVRVSLRRTVGLSGFHRNLELHLAVESNSTVAMKDCVVKITQNLSRDAFMDHYQIAQLTKQVYFPVEVDLEEAAHHSTHQSSQIFFLISRLSVVESSQLNLTLPFHLRYQPAQTSAEDGDIASVAAVLTPDISFRCEESVPPNSCKSVETDRCQPNELSFCSWCKLNEVQVPTVLHLNIPRGNMAHRTAVLYITLVVIFVGFATLVFQLFK